MSAPLLDSADTSVLDEVLRRCVFPTPASVVACAVSGGADSVALLALAVRHGLVVTAVHVDHGLRADSAVDGAFVEDLAQRLGAGFRLERVAVAPGPNLEARARAARYDALPKGALLGHTLDDQAETMLLNLVRGAGPLGMAAMPADERRPLLRIRRSDTEAVCSAIGVTPLADPTNDDPRIRRNRVRAELLPLLDDIAERDVAPVLARQASIFAEQADALAESAAAVEPTDCAALQSVHPAVASVAIRRWLRDATAAEHPIDEAAVARVLRVVRNEVLATEVGGGWRVSRHRQRLTVTRPTSTGSVSPG